MRLRLLPKDSRLGWTPFAWLVYLSFFLVLAVLQNEPWEWLIDGPALAAFLVLYFRGFWVGGGQLLAVIFGIVGIAVLTSLRNPGASCFFIYAAAFAGELGPPSRSLRWLLVIVAIAGLEAWFAGLTAVFWVPAIVISLIIGGTNIHFSEVNRKNRELIRAHEEAERLARVAERERIARDLHDLLGHTLSVIVLKSELAARLADRDMVRAAGEMRDIERISRDALAEVRRAIHGYRGERLADELERSRTALEAAGTAFEASIEPVSLPADTERALALALREAITNVVRHARATRCVVALTADGDTITLRVEDDGVGGDLVEGAGLSGMKARIAEAGGRLKHDGRGGTRLTITVPALEGPARAQAAS